MSVVLSPVTKDTIILWSAIAGIVVCFVVVLDFSINRWGYIKRVAQWLWSGAKRIRPDSSAVELEISATPLSVTLPTGISDGVTKICVMYIMCGGDQLLAYTTTREGFPGTRFLVVRIRPNQQPQSCDTPNRAEANGKWNEWYREWKTKGFGGASGTGLLGTLPF